MPIIVMATAQNSVGAVDFATCCTAAFDEKSPGPNKAVKYAIPPTLFWAVAITIMGIAGKYTYHVCICAS